MKKRIIFLAGLLCGLYTQAQQTRVLKIKMSLVSSWQDNYPYLISSMNPALAPEAYTLPKKMSRPFLIKEVDFIGQQWQSLWRRRQQDTSALKEPVLDILFEKFLPRLF